MRCPMCGNDTGTKVAVLKGYYLCWWCAGFVVWENRKWARR